MAVGPLPREITKQRRASYMCFCAVWDILIGPHMVKGLKDVSNVNKNINIYI